MLSELTQVDEGTVFSEPRNITPNTAEPPIEVLSTLLESGTAVGGPWLAVPSLYPVLKRTSLKEIQASGSVNAYELVRPFLGNQRLNQTLRIMDVFDGCGHHCDTCLADAALPSRMFSFESLERLFADEDFLTMLQPDSIRFGSSGDVLDHPQGVEIVTMALAKTQTLDDKRMQREGKHHQVKVMTNYRPNTEAQINELIALALEYPNRFQLCISMPFNRVDTVNKRVATFIGARPAIFRDDYPTDASGLIDFEYGRTRHSNITINDTRHPRPLHMVGRVLSSEFMEDISHVSSDPDDRRLALEERGLVKTYLNPDALWLMIYATPYESHTTRVFTPITPTNIDAFSQLPYHPDFPTPPNWPGGKGQLKTRQQVDDMNSVMQKNGKPMRNLVVIE